MFVYVYGLLAELRGAHRQDQRHETGPLRSLFCLTSVLVRGLTEKEV